MDVKRNQKGFGITSLIVLICVITAVGLVGWLVYQNSKTVIHNTPATEVTLKAPAQPQAVDNLHITSLPDISTSSWHDFQENNGKISYRYPSDWTFKNSGFVYYGPSEAASHNQSAIQTLISPGSDSKADYDYGYKKLSGAKITIRVVYEVNEDDATPSDYCTTLKDQKFFLEELPNNATPLCVGMTSSGSFYQVGASYCGLLFSADIILGGQNTLNQNQEYLQVLIGMAKTWDFKNVCATGAQGVQYLYFGP
ncbi:MAG TPA: hypothetical protein VF261_00545 [Candidatus Saccharimonadales bacterium]